MGFRGDHDCRVCLTHARKQCAGKLYIALKFTRVRVGFMLGIRIGYQVQRHRLSWDRYPEGGWTVNFDEPYKVGKEPLAAIER